MSGRCRGYDQINPRVKRRHRVAEKQGESNKLTGAKITPVAGHHG